MATIIDADIAQQAFADGSASAPSWSFLLDSNTGVFRPTADTIGFSLGGTERARLTTSGLDVGTNSILFGSAIGTNESSILRLGANILGVKVGVVEAIRYDATGVVVNEGSADRDFRVESKDNAYMVYVDGAKNSLVLGSNTDVSDADLKVLLDAKAWTAAVNASVARLKISNTNAITEAASGTHAIIASLHLKEPNITGAGATTTEAATLYIEDAPTEGASNHALHVASGTSKMEGNLLGISGGTNGPAVALGEQASTTNPVFIIGQTAMNNGIGGGTGSVSLINGGAESLRTDTDTTARNTRLLVYDVDNATLERVSVGAADSGAAGYKVLRIPN